MANPPWLYFDPDFVHAVRRAGWPTTRSQLARDIAYHGHSAAVRTKDEIRRVKAVAAKAGYTGRIFVMGPREWEPPCKVCRP